MALKKASKIAFIIVLLLAVFYFIINLVMLLSVRGQGEVDVPDLTGLTSAEAYERLTVLKLFLTKDGEQHNAVIPAGNIISQNPLPGSRVKAGRKIKVIISKGSEKVIVPNVLSKSWREAEIAVRESGLSIPETVRVYSAHEIDTIVLQEPAAGTEIEKGSAVTLVASAGPLGPEAEMPNLLSRPYLQAEKYVKIMGLKIGNVTTEVNDKFESGTVLAQNPEPHAPLNETTQVYFVISVTSGEENDAAKIKMLYYEVGQGLFEKRVRIVVSDESGEREVFNAPQAPGSKVNVGISVKGKATAKIFVNEVLVEEREM